MADSKKGVNLDELQAETEKLLALLKDRQGTTMWNRFMREQVEKVHKLTSQALGRVVCNFPVWKTIRLGTGFKTADHLRKILNSCCYLNAWAEDIFLGKPTITVNKTEKKVNLVVVSTAELTHKMRASREEIYRAAKGKGLDLCPAEVGPQLCLQQEHRPSICEKLLIGMKPIRDSGGCLSVFCLINNAYELSLDGDYGCSGTIWTSNDLWVFVKPKE